MWLAIGKAGTVEKARRRSPKSKLGEKSRHQAVRNINAQQQSTKKTLQRQGAKKSNRAAALKEPRKMPAGRVVARRSVRCRRSQRSLGRFPRAWGGEARRRPGSATRERGPDTKQTDPGPTSSIRSLEIINTSYQKLPFGSGDDPDKLFFHQVLN